MVAGKTECVLIFKRIYDAPVARLWRAWTEASELGKWYLAGDDHVIQGAEVDLRVGGSYRVAFGPPGKPPYVETGRYIEIIPLKRLAWVGEVTSQDKTFIEGRTEVEFVDLGDGRTQVVLTNTGDEDLWRSGEGWTPCLASLERYLAAGA